jgi:RNA recognition motif-containing protein
MTKVPDAKTIYIKGLPDKPPVAEIRRALYLYCAQFGPVLDVHVPKVRGQAFVVFPDLAIANTCRRVMHGVSFYNRTVHVSLSDKPSFLADPAERRRRDTRLQSRSSVADPEAHRKRLREES